ncbi:hypothetical protein GLOTRDRAFT_132900 [Gloeophyllum trabeum ATCC 11539]|uniref:Aminoglycoside phosphotransferase domain-containing protein n=1 Tax=Gloeophyllum trabeum (strain ATCC 11539 / FP-39264 / Madison 617) TaxID=670483 RepID=S7PVL0_GLOTA|nr:uncharacterized protein GLOTRDRAFT_132900 [Gloeophyllum trabeum ATCC 11539]EPQ51533.1 hypothetical protein GLOTRDRAFT_132900 [Gloeophyllum trabeum ATCC 11539]
MTSAVGNSADSSSNRSAPINVSLDQARAILERATGQDVEITSLKELKSYGYSLPNKVYEIQSTSGDPAAPSTYILTVTSQDTPSETEYRPNTLLSSAHLHSLISSKSCLPLLPLLTTDTTLTLVPFAYTLSPAPAGTPLSAARALLSARQNALVDLRLGQYLAQLHALENDWFGVPTDTGADPREPSYSWQESFTLFLEEVLWEAERRGAVLPYGDIRGWLSRAIGYYLFDDVEVPKLVWFTGGEDEVLVEVPEKEEEEPRIRAFLNIAHAFWGDPLLESLFQEPSKALMEGYGGPLVQFPRQNTKRLWYTLFWGLVVMREAEGGENEERKRWALEVVQKALDELKDAPSY